VKTFKLKSFCKINLSLHVLSKLSSGYHNILSFITFCNPHDIISITETNLLKDQITFSGKFKDNINLQSNTITKVLYKLRKKKFLKKKFFKIGIKKNIPHGSGLGGGSSNAATLLNFFKLKMRLKINKKEMINMANQIGSDVVIALAKKNTIITGKKNKILRINNKLNLNVINVYPNIRCSTKKIYQKNKKFSPKKSILKYPFKNKNKLINFLKNENNDLQQIVIKLHPKIEDLINSIDEQNGCYFSRITGSGSACIGIFSDIKAAIFAQKMIKLKFPKYWSVVSKSI